ncbi:DUF2071 domain-containing protein [Riemerella columbina]|uniref:DUF2071 domain-containing protein n=1 Tax=Riemerella columbina TaxID=103810 RepID=UPI0003794B06|nr:DUF2071 domain-containing protein [Riemerella columbina]
MSVLKNHPFAVEAFFEHSIVLTFAVPKEELEKFLPKCLSLDTHNNQWGFIAVALVKTKNICPKGFPKFLGKDFILTGYRIFVRYKNNQGKRLRGLYILKSETNKKMMALLGSIFTEYHYQWIDIEWIENQRKTSITSEKGNFKINTKTSTIINLPPQSPFKDWKEARRFAGPLPFTFSYNEKSNEVLIVEGIRQNWTPKPIVIEDHHFQFINKLQLEGIVLASAFEIRNIPYFWKKGIIELWY